MFGKNIYKKLFFPSSMMKQKLSFKVTRTVNIELNIFDIFNLTNK